MYENLTDSEITIAAVTSGVIVWDVRPGRTAKTFTLSGVTEGCEIDDNFQPILSKTVRSRLEEHMRLKTQEPSVLD